MISIKTASHTLGQYPKSQLTSKLLDLSTMLFCTRHYQICIAFIIVYNVFKVYAIIVFDKSSFLLFALYDKIHTSTNCNLLNSKVILLLDGMFRVVLFVLSSISDLHLISSDS